MPKASSRVIKYHRVKEEVAKAIAQGDYALGERLPSEKQLADQHNVSIITVRQAVEALAREGFVEKIQGSGTFVRHIRPLVERKLWAFVVPSLADPWYAQVAHGLAEVAAAAGIQILLADTDRDEEPGETIRRLVTLGVSGFAVAPSLMREVQSQPFEELMLAGIPFVFAGNYVEGVNAPRVLIDYSQGGRLATEHLLALGHRRIALCSYPQSAVARRIWDGYVNALHHAGLAPCPADPLSADSWDKTDLYRCARGLLELSPGPTAVLCTHDTIACSVAEAARDAGVAIPEQLSVVGFYNLARPLEGRVPLTSVGFAAGEGGQALGKTLLRLVMDGPVEREVLLPCHLNEGSTTAPPPPEE